MLRPLIEVDGGHRSYQMKMWGVKNIASPGKYYEETFQLGLPGWVNVTLQVGSYIENPFNSERLMTSTPIDVISAVAGPIIDHYQIALFYTPSQRNPNMKFAGKIVYGNNFDIFYLNSLTLAHFITHYVKKKIHLHVHITDDCIRFGFSNHKQHYFSDDAIYTFNDR